MHYHYHQNPCRFGRTSRSTVVESSSMLLLCKYVPVSLELYSTYYNLYINSFGEICAVFTPWIDVYPAVAVTEDGQLQCGHTPHPRTVINSPLRGAQFDVAGAGVVWPVTFRGRSWVQNGNRPGQSFKTGVQARLGMTEICQWHLVRLVSWQWQLLKGRTTI